MNQEQKVQKIIKTLDEMKVLLSGSFRSRQERYLRSITGNYKNKLVFQPGNVSTDGDTVYADPTSGTIVDLNLLKKIAAIRGQIAHEAFHILYTDFSSVKKMAKEAMRADDEGRFRIAQRKSYLNIVEDGAIELAGCTEFPGLAPYIRLLNDTAFEKLPSLEQVEQTGNRLKAHQIACAQYGIIGRVKGEFQDPELREVFERSKPHLDRGRVARTTKDRLKESDAILKLAEPFIREQIEKGNMDEDEFQNPKGNDMNEQGNGQGRPMPPDPTEFRKSKSQKSQEEKKQQTSSSSPETQNEQKEEEDQQQGSGKGTESQAQEEQEKQQEVNEDTNGQPSSDEKSLEDETEPNESGSGENEHADNKPESNEADEDREGPDASGEESDGSDNQSHQSSEQNPSPNPQSSSEGDDDDVSESDEEEETEENEEDEELKELMKEMEQELQETMTEMEKEEASSQQSQSREEMIKRHLGKLKYSDKHQGITVKANFDYPKSESIKTRYLEELEEVKPLAKNLARRLKNMIRYNQEAKYAGLANGHLDQSALWRKDGNIFYQKKEKSDEADLVVLILEDESQSMQISNRFIHARKTSILMAEVCEELKIPFGVIGHTALWRTKKVSHEHYITFEKPISEQKMNLARITYKDNTREGVSLKYAYEYLMKQPQKDKLLIVISDGEPYHVLPDGRYFGGEEAQVDAALVVEEYAKKGITTIGVAIGDGRDEIAKIYKNYISITKLDRLPAKLVNLLQKKLFKD